MANGRPALKGTCPVCGTGMFKILAARQVAARRPAAQAEFRPSPPGAALRAGPDSLYFYAPRCMTIHPPECDPTP